MVNAGSLYWYYTNARRVAEKRRPQLLDVKTNHEARKKIKFPLEINRAYVYLLIIFFESPPWVLVNPWVLVRENVVCVKSNFLLCSRWKQIGLREF